MEIRNSKRASFSRKRVTSVANIATQHQTYGETIIKETRIIITEKPNSKENVKTVSKRTTRQLIVNKI